MAMKKHSQGESTYSNDCDLRDLFYGTGRRNNNNLHSSAKPGTNDGAIVMSCSSPGGRLIVTTSPYR